MIFEETILPKGTRVYKGVPKGVYSPHRTTHFFVTKDPRVARHYGSNVILYETVRPIRMFRISHQNIRALIQYYPLNETTKDMLRFAFGTFTTRARQIKAFHALLQRTPVRFTRTTRKAPGQRLSNYRLDRQAIEKLTREFLIPEGYHGYIADSKKSVFGGDFHPEIMVCDARKTLRRVSVNIPKPRPSVSQYKVVKNLAPLFIEYSKKQRRLVRPYGGFVIYLGGGMAIKLYMEARALQAPKKVLDTQDFDFTFATPHPLRSKIQVAARSYVMKQIMTAHVNGFVKWLENAYGVRPNIHIKEFVPPVQYFPVLKKHVYHVISYSLQFPGTSKPIGLVDTTLAHVSGIRRDHVHPTFSKYFGIPIERLKYQTKNVLAVLASSFATKDPSLKSRNPLVGNRSEKGLKNTARLAALLRSSKHQPTTTVQKFIQNIQKGRTKNAFKHAKLVLRNIK